MHPALRAMFRAPCIMPEVLSPPSQTRLTLQSPLQRHWAPRQYCQPKNRPPQCFSPPTRYARTYTANRALWRWCGRGPTTGSRHQPRTRARPLPPRARSGEARAPRSSSRARCENAPPAAGARGVAGRGVPARCARGSGCAAARRARVHQLRPSARRGNAARGRRVKGRTYKIPNSKS